MNLENNENLSNYQLLKHKTPLGRISLHFSIFLTIVQLYFAWHRFLQWFQLKFRAGNFPGRNRVRVHCACSCVWPRLSASPAKNVWLVDAWPRDISKFKMAALPPSFVYSSGKKVILRLNMSCKCIYGYFFSIAQTFYHPSSPIPMGFVPCDARVLAVLPDSSLDLFKRSLFTITKDNISEKSRVTRKKGHCSQLNAAEK